MQDVGLSQSARVNLSFPLTARNLRVVPGNQQPVVASGMATDEESVREKRLGSL